MTVKAVAGPADHDAPWEQRPVSAASFNGKNRKLHEEFRTEAMAVLRRAGAREVLGPHQLGWVVVSAVVEDADKKQFVVLTHGVFDDDPQAGLRRTDTLKKAGFDVWGLKNDDPDRNIIVVTSHLPTGRHSTQMLRLLRQHSTVVTIHDWAVLCRMFGGVPPVEASREVLTPADDQLELFGAPDA